MAQMKEQSKTSERELINEEIANPKRNTPSHIIIKLLKIKDKEKNLAVRGKETVTYKGVPI